MSRKGKTVIPLPKGVSLSLQNDNTPERELIVKGPKGTLHQPLPQAIEFTVNDNTLSVSLNEKNSDESEIHGLYWALIDNMVRGVAEGFVKRLEMIGVGFRAAVQGDLLDVQVGYSHPTKLKIPQGVTISVEKNTLITVSGVDKQLVGQFAADIRSKRPPEPYKGKGIRYKDEYVRKKAGKTAKK